MNNSLDKARLLQKSLAGLNNSMDKVIISNLPLKAARRERVGMCEHVGMCVAP